MGYSSVEDAIRRTHKLMSTLEDHDYRVYSSETNLLANEPTCVEFGLKRRNPCPA